MMVIHRMGKRILTLDQGKVASDSAMGGDYSVGQA
jgi:hypothetical protein